MTQMIDFSSLPAPTVIEALDYETVFTEIRADLIASAPHLAPALNLESDDLTKMLQVFAYRELGLRQRINDAARACMLPYATGADLENLAALFNVARATITPADDSTIPPTPAVMENDDRLRHRAQLALEGFSAAGPTAAYEFWALTASAQVADVAVDSPQPGVVRVAVLATDGDGTPPADVLTTVTQAVNDRYVRPLCDTVQVQAAGVVPVTVNATLTLFPGPDSATVLATARARVLDYINATRRIGRDVTISGLHAALHISGAVQRVDLTSPAADVAIDGTSAAYCDPQNVALTFGGTDV